MARPKKAESPSRQALARIMIISSDASQDRFLPREEARSRYEVGDLARDVDSNCDYCLATKDYNPLTDHHPRIPAFLLNALRRG